MIHPPEYREAKALVRKYDRAKRKEAPRAVPTAKGQREPRVRDPAYLAWLRRQGCCYGAVSGGCEGPIEAAHVRFSSAKYGKVNPGMQRKPDDIFALPNCRLHHALQHSKNEAAHWATVGIDPLALCLEMRAKYEAMT